MQREAKQALRCPGVSHSDLPVGSSGVGACSMKQVMAVDNVKTTYLAIGLFGKFETQILRARVFCSEPMPDWLSNKIGCPINNAFSSKTVSSLLYEFRNVTQGKVKQAFAQTVSFVLFLGAK